MSDSKTVFELHDGLHNVSNLHEFAELFGFCWDDDSDWTWHDVAVKMADDFEQAVAATLGSGECKVTYKELIWTCQSCGVSWRQELDYPNFCPNCGKAVKR